MRRSVLTRFRTAIFAIASVVSSVAFTVPTADEFERDLFHARRAFVGGPLARAWIAFDYNGDTYVRSFIQDGSSADPTVHVPALSGASHRYIDLGSGPVDAADVVDAFIASLALDGITAFEDGVADDGRPILRIEGASNLVIPPDVDTSDTSLRGMWGFQRNDWGASPPQNGNGGTDGTGAIHLGNPSSQPGLSGRAGRVLGVYMWAHSSFAPRLGVAVGPSYAADPGAMTALLGEAVASPITDFGMVFFPAAAFSSTDQLWAFYRDTTSGAAPNSRGPIYRLHGQDPVGNGDIVVGQQLTWDTTTNASSSNPFGNTYNPVANNNYNIYIAIGVLFELQDASGNYPANGYFRTWIGDQNTDPAHGTRFDAGPALIDQETTHHRFLMPNWTDYGAIEYRRAVGAIASDEDSRIAYYGPWASLAFPASPPPPLHADVGPMGISSANDYNVLTFPTRVEFGTEVIGTDAYMSVGANYVRTGGGAISVYTLPVFLDQSTGDNSWLNCWLDNRRGWHDDIPGASGARALPSGQTEYRTTATPGMPINSPTDTYPDPMAVAAGNDSPNAIALEASLFERFGFQAVA